MNCRKVSNLISAYIDGELPGVEHSGVHEHLKACRECREEYEGVLQMKRLLSHIKVQEPRPELSNDILARLHAERETASPAPPFWRVWLTPSRSLMTATSALLLVAITVLAFSKDPNEIRWTPASQAAREGLLPSPSAQGSPTSYFSPQGGGISPAANESFFLTRPGADWREPLAGLTPAKSERAPKSQNLTDILNGSTR